MVSSIPSLFSSCLMEKYINSSPSFSTSPTLTDLEWKAIYVGSAESSSHDQVLDEILVGPVPVGVNKFVLQADAPDASTIPESDVIGVTVVLVTCSYKDQEFARIGYYVNNEYAEEYDFEVGPPSPIDLNKVNRTILADKPRVTRFPINWTGKQDTQASQDVLVSDTAAGTAQHDEEDEDGTVMMDEDEVGAFEDDAELDEDEANDVEEDESPMGFIGAQYQQSSSVLMSPVATSGSNAVVSPDDAMVTAE